MKATKLVRTMEFQGYDSWGRPVYRCLETGNLYKNIVIDALIPVLYSCGNSFEGEPDLPINGDLSVRFRTMPEENPNKFNYMMLDRLRSDCDYFLGYGHRSTSRLCEGNVVDHIKRMKELHNSFPEGQKPEWLTYESILEYERQMMD